LCPQFSQDRGHENGSRHAIHIKVTVDGDMLAAADSLPDARDSMVHVTQVPRILQLAITEEKGVDHGRSLDVPGIQNSGDDRIELGVLVQEGLGGATA